MPLDEEPQKTEERRRRRSVKSFMKATASLLMVVLASLLASAAVIVIFGPQTFHWRAFDVDVSIAPSMRGQTRLWFPPLGEVIGHTHRSPVRLTISLRSIGFDEAKALISKPPPRLQLEQEFTRVAKKDLKEFTIKQAILGAIGGLFGPLIFRSKRLRVWIICVIAGGIFVGSMVVLTVKTYDPKAFESPTYSGSLKQAEWIIGMVKDGFVRAEALSEKLRHVAKNLSTLYRRIDALPRSGDDVDTISVLHISDIHNNSAAVSFVQQLVKDLRVDLVIDTGDLTDFGSPLEADLAKGIGSIPVPYVFVAGNHDSPALIQAVKSRQNAIVLENSVVTVKGITILGAGDPSSTGTGAGHVDTTSLQLQQAGTVLTKVFEATKPPPVIVCVHNLKQAVDLIGRTGLILFGHDHRSSVTTTRGTVLCDAGTTGAEGGRYFDSPHGAPLSAAVLNFTRSPIVELRSIDLIELSGSFGQYSITRTTFPTSVPDAKPAPLPQVVAPGLN